MQARFDFVISFFFENCEVIQTISSIFLDLNIIYELQLFGKYISILLAYYLVVHVHV